MHPGQVADLSQGQQVEGYDHSCSHSHLQPFYSHVKKKVFSWVVLLCLKNLRSLFSVCLDCSLKLCLTMLLQLKEVYGHLYIHSSFKVQCISLRFRPELFTGLLQDLDFPPPIHSVVDLQLYLGSLSIFFSYGLFSIQRSSWSTQG